MDGYDNAAGVGVQCWPWRAFGPSAGRVEANSLNIIVPPDYDKDERFGHTQLRVREAPAGSCQEGEEGREAQTQAGSGETGP